MGLLCVVRGRLRLFRFVASGRSHTLRVLNPGDCHCVSPVHGEMVSPLTVKCDTDADVIWLRGDRIAPLLASSHGASRRAIRCLAERLSRAVRDGSERPLRTVRQRVAAALQQMAAAGEKRPDGRVVLDGISHEEIASLAATVREVASRALASLEKAGVLRRGRGRITLLDPCRLEAACRRPAR